MKRNDILWKVILEDVFDDFLRFFIPDVDRLLDLSRDVEYLDKEMDQLFQPRGNNYKPRYVDKLAKVHTRRGTEEWILVHIEVQGYRDSQFAKRMFQYYTRIWDKYERPVVAFAIFTDPGREFHPRVFEQSFLGTSLCYKFNTYKILEQSEAALAKNPNPFAVIALTVKTALKGKKINSQELYNLKLSLLRGLADSKMRRDKAKKILHFLDSYIRFENPEMNDNFNKEIDVVTQNRLGMGIEEYLMQKTREEGIQEGEERLMERLIKSHLHRKQFSPEQISEMLEIPIARILSIQKDMEDE